MAEYEDHPIARALGGIVGATVGAAEGVTNLVKHGVPPPRCEPRDRRAAGTPGLHAADQVLSARKKLYCRKPASKAALM